MSNTLYVAWRAGGDRNGQWGPVGRLDRRETGYRFCYTHGAQELEGFRPFAGMPDLQGVYEADELFPLFANRVLAPSRPEYDALFVWSDLDRSSPDPIALLGVTGGRRATDSYEVFPEPQPDVEGRYVSKFFLHGLRHREREAIDHVTTLSPGQRLELRQEQNNEFDPNAVAVDSEGLHIGYVPRYLARDIRLLLGHGASGDIRVSVVRVNGDAPLQQRLLCRIEAAWPGLFRPCAQHQYQPIASPSATRAA